MPSPCMVMADSELIITGPYTELFTSIIAESTLPKLSIIASILFVSSAIQLLASQLYKLMLLIWEQESFS